MTAPAPRSASGMSGVGAKITPFASAAEYANFGCGGRSNGDPGVEQPTVAYSPGDTITVSWQLTIPHPDDRLTDGVRIAMHYGADDSFTDNILAGGVAGDGTEGTLAVGEEDDARDTIVSETVTLPNKLCDFCTLQWIWSAQGDGGSYIGCADISITANGQLPDFTAVPSEVGNILPGVAQSPPPPLPPGVSASPSLPPGTAGDASNVETGGGGSTAGAVIGVLVALVVIGGGGYYYFQVRGKQAASSTLGNTAVAMQGSPPPPPPGPTALPPGWSEGKDPASGVAYYYNASTGQTQWTKPLG